MAGSKTFSGVTAEVFQCVKATSKKEHNTDYTPADGNKGEAVTKHPLAGTIALEFDFDPLTSTITYTIKSKSWIVSESSIWNGIQETINKCIK